MALPALKLIAQRPLVKPDYTSTKGLTRAQWLRINHVALSDWYASLDVIEQPFMIWSIGEYADQAVREEELAKPFVSHTVANYEQNCRTAGELARRRGFLT